MMEPVYSREALMQALRGRMPKASVDRFVFLLSELVCDFDGVLRGCERAVDGKRLEMEDLRQMVNPIVWHWPRTISELTRLSRYLEEPLRKPARRRGRAERRGKRRARGAA